MNTNLLRSISIATISVLAASFGCAQTAYNTLQNMQNMNCEKMQGTQREECLHQDHMSYDEYQRQLKNRESDPNK